MVWGDAQGGLLRRARFANRGPRGLSPLAVKDLGCVLLARDSNPTPDPRCFCTSRCPDFEFRGGAHRMQLKPALAGGGEDNQLSAVDTAVRDAVARRLRPAAHQPEWSPPVSPHRQVRELQALRGGERAVVTNGRSTASNMSARRRPARPAAAGRAGEQWWETEARDLKEQLKMARNGPMSGNPGHWDYRTGDRQRHAEPKR